ncbi:MAG: nitroreductase family protein [Thermomicrobiales bacterium]
MSRDSPNDAQSVIDLLTHLRQARQFDGRPVPPAIVDALLEVARWTGSALNRQPWHFIVLDCPDQLQGIANLSPRIGWVAGASLAIAVVLDNQHPLTELHDEGRVTERLLIAATALGLGGGTAWFDAPDQQAAARAMLGVPEGYLLKSVIAFGYPTTYADPRPGGRTTGRKPLSALVGQGRFPTPDDPAGAGPDE